MSHQPINEENQGMINIIEVANGLHIHITSHEFFKLIRLVNKNTVTVHNDGSVSTKDPNTHAIGNSYNNIITALREEFKPLQFMENVVVFDDEILRIGERNEIPGDMLFNLRGEITKNNRGIIEFRATPRGRYRYIEIHWGGPNTPGHVDFEVLENHCYYKHTECCGDMMPHNVTHLIVDDKPYVIDSINLSK